jgi:hypothetical protein
LCSPASLEEAVIETAAVFLALETLVTTSISPVVPD